MGLPTSEEKNSLDEFMLQEYSSIASAHFDSQVGLRQQFRFYLIIAAAPLTVLGLALKDRTSTDLEKVQLLQLPHPVGYVLIAVGALGSLMLLSMIHTALDATLYARTVNGVRHYFYDRGTLIGADILPYLKMPIDDTRPKYFHLRAFFWTVFLTSLINSTYYLAGMCSLHGSTNWWLFFIAALIFLGHLAAYRYFCRQRERQEVSR